MKLSELVRLCEKWMHDRKYSPTTIATYDTVYLQFRSYLTSLGLDDDVRSFNDETAEGYKLELEAKGAKASTVLQRLSALSTLAKFGMRCPKESTRPKAGKAMLSDPTRTFDWPRAERAETKYLLPAELHAFLAVPRPPEESLVRDFLVETGVRVSEAANASVKDLRQDMDGSVWVRLRVKSRGARHVEFPLSPPLAEAIRDRLLTSGRATEPEAPIFVNAEGRRWSRTGLAQLIFRIGAAAGITRLRMSPHKLRHSANVIARLSGIDPYQRSQLLGHSSTSALARYEHLIPGEMHRARQQQMDGLSRYLGAFGHSSENDPASHTDGGGEPNQIKS